MRTTYLSNPTNSEFTFFTPWFGSKTGVYYPNSEVVTVCIYQE